MHDPEVLKSIDEGLELWDKLPHEVQWAKIMELERRMGLRRDAEGNVIYPDLDESPEPPAARSESGQTTPDRATADAG